MEGLGQGQTAGQCQGQDLSFSKEATVLRKLFCSASHLAEAFWLSFISYFLSFGIWYLTTFWKKLQAFLRLLSGCYQCYYQIDSFFYLESPNNPIYREQDKNKEQKTKQQQQKTKKLKPYSSVDQYWPLKKTMNNISIMEVSNNQNNFSTERLLSNHIKDRLYTYRKPHPIL